ncbi:hypothetical protein OG607_41355 [Streptomyces sp. NBC_01537]|uniref:hypothetical protein n=1 Tax=Streptomyces sp. NBC_01537 TaxID=2903896 RepID=UPI003868BFAD
MSSPNAVSQATLEYLARRLDDLAADFPNTSAGVDLGTLTDHIAMLTHHLDYANGRAQERFTAAETVYLPERGVLQQLAEAAVGITGALNILAQALAHAAHGYRTEAIPGIGHTHLRGDQATTLTIVAAKYADARARLTDTAAALHPAPVRGSSSGPLPTAIPATRPTPPPPGKDRTSAPRR